MHMGRKQSSLRDVPSQRGNLGVPKNSFKTIYLSFDSFALTLTLSLSLSATLSLPLSLFLSFFLSLSLSLSVHLKKVQNDEEPGKKKSFLDWMLEEFFMLLEKVLKADFQMTMGITYSYATN
jgi:hypothetical protein